jgi:hypothetical protein
MTAGRTHRNQGIVEHYDFTSLSRVVDIGGGEGSLVALLLVKGSHTWGKMFPRLNFHSSSHAAATSEIPTTQTIPDVDSDAGTYDVLSWELNPGDCVVFYCNMLHSAPSHPHTGRARWVYSTRWTGEDARFVIRDWLVPALPSDPGLLPGDPIGGELFPRVL